MSSAFLVFDFVGRKASFRKEGSPRSCIELELNDIGRKHHCERIESMDKYPNFEALRVAQKENIGFVVRIAGRNSSTVIIAPHGGGIEPGTSEIVEAIAGPDLLFVDFAGIKKGGNTILHITSTNFDEPRCTALVAAAETVLAVHGCEDPKLSEERAVVYIGGKDGTLASRVRDALTKATFRVEKHPNHELQGIADKNICNRNRRGAGVQLELSLALRKTFFESLDAVGRQYRKSELIRFANAVREGLGAGKLP
jgi:phage replication-related protein YjqB (UPF0714/DUF867 family)